MEKNGDQFFSGNFGHSEMERSIGELIVRCGRLERVLDDFIWKVVELHPEVALAISRDVRCLNSRDFRCAGGAHLDGKPPSSFEEKIRFVVGAVLRIGFLRKVPFYIDDIDANYQTFFWSLMEMHATRNHIVHGSIDLLQIKSEEGQWRLTVNKDQKLKKMKGWYERRKERVAITSDYIDRQINVADLWQKHIRKLMLTFDGPNWIEKHAEAQRQILRNHAWLKKNLEAFEPNSPTDLARALGILETE